MSRLGIKGSHRAPLSICRNKTRRPKNDSKNRAKGQNVSQYQVISGLVSRVKTTKKFGTFLAIFYRPNKGSFQSSFIIFFVFHQDYQQYHHKMRGEKKVYLSGKVILVICR